MSVDRVTRYMYMNSTVVHQTKKDQDIVYWYSPLTSPFSFNPLMDFEFHHWTLLERITTDNIKGSHGS